MLKSYDYTSVMRGYGEARNERMDWETEWRKISNYLVPGRGIYQTYSRPRKRKLTNTGVINSAAEDALYVLTSGMHGGLTSPSRPWFRLAWTDNRIKGVPPLVSWLQDCERRLYTALSASSFYSIVNSFYIEYAGFGTGCTYLGEDGEGESPFRFELLTAGEYAFTMGADGRPSTFYRTIYMSQRQLVERFGKRVSPQVREKVENNGTGIDVVDLSVVEMLFKHSFQDKPWTRVTYEVSSGSGSSNLQPYQGPGGSSRITPRGGGHDPQAPLEVRGFYEFPYPLARWGTIGQDIYGLGPGSRCIPDVKRLQEMEKAFLMATHKSIDPPLYAPSKLRGKLNSFPGGRSYYSNPQDTVTELYSGNFDYNGVSAATDRVEQRIQRTFFNDIFLTASRDPNASPLKARQVEEQSQEKMLRLGPVIERLQHEFYQPLIERCFNIMLRKGLFAILPPELQAMAGEYQISLVSPLATAQRAMALQGINSFMGFLGQAAQFDPSIMDNVDPDKAAREYADITGVHNGVLRPEEDVKRIREKRRAQMEADKKAQQDIQMAETAAKVAPAQAAAQKDQSEAGLNLLEGQSIRQEMGVF